MKRKCLIILLLAILILPVYVFAKGSFNVSSTSITMYPGESKTITITTSDSVGKLNISTSNGGVASVSASSVFIDTIGAKKTFTIKANSVGSVNVSVVGSENYASFSDEISLKGLTKTIKVNVVEKPIDNRSKNNNLKSLSIDGYQLVKLNNNNYTLNVNNNVTSVNVNALAEDSKAKVSGTGKYELKVGENIIKVVVTAENGSKNDINIKITRKDGYYLDDLETLLKDEKVNDIDIIITNDSKITKNDIDKINTSKKKVNFNYFDENKKLIYSWIIDGTKIKNGNDILTSIIYDSENKEIISELSNYADGIYINFKHDGSLPEGVKVKIYVGDKYQNKNIVNIYTYNGEKIELIKNNITVEDGYIVFDLEHSSEYFVTRSILGKCESNVGQTIDIYMITSIIELIIILVLIILIINIRNKNNNNNNIVNNDINSKLFDTEDDVFPSDDIGKDVIMEEPKSNDAENTFVETKVEPIINMNSNDFIYQNNIQDNNVYLNDFDNNVNTVENNTEQIININNQNVMPTIETIDFAQKLPIINNEDNGQNNNL